MVENLKGDGLRKMDEIKMKKNDCKCLLIEICYNIVCSISEVEKRGFYRKIFLYKKD